MTSTLDPSTSRSSTTFPFNGYTFCFTEHIFCAFKAPTTLEAHGYRQGYIGGGVEAIAY